MNAVLLPLPRAEVEGVGAVADAEVELLVEDAEVGLLPVAVEVAPPPEDVEVEAGVDTPLPWPRQWVEGPPVDMLEAPPQEEMPTSEEENRQDL